MLSKRMLELIQRSVWLDVNGYAHDFFCIYAVIQTTEWVLRLIQKVEEENEESGSEND